LGQQIRDEWNFVQHADVITAQLNTDWSAGIKVLLGCEKHATQPTWLKFKIVLVILVV